MRKIAILALFILAAFTAACNAVPATGDNANQVLSAQSQMPPPPSGYQTLDGDSIQGAINAAATAANLTTANLLGAAMVNRIDTLVTCYRDAGAVDVKAYFSIMEAGGGVAIVTNNDRLAGNLIQCINEAAGGRNNGTTAQDASFKPCSKGGAFEVTSGETTNTFSYIYVGSTPALCNAFEAHFTSKGG